MAEFAVQESDVLDVPSDLLLLKHAQAFYGADRAVATRLVSAGLCAEEQLRPAPGDFVLIETDGAIAPKRVLFLGTPPLRSFTYTEMETFACRAVERIADLGLPVRTITTTVHGAGYGLDGGEALQRLVGGFRRGLLRQKSAPIERITFLTLGQRTERMLRNALAHYTTEESPAETTVHDTATQRESPSESRIATRVAEGAAVEWSVATEMQTLAKRRVFVALPFSEEFQNVYEYGIYPAVRNCGFVCERVDETHFTGDVLERIRDGIRGADLVIADLTEGRPNVYLEVGYAWGKDVPVIFVARKEEKLHFDVSTHRCIFYGNFRQFAKHLEELIRGIAASTEK